MRRILSTARLIPILFCGTGLVSCEGHSVPGPGALESYELQAKTEQSNNPLFGSWELTSVIVAGEEVFAETGGSYILTLKEDGTHSSLGSDGTQSVSWGGWYTYTISTITIDDSNHPDPDEQGIDTSIYALCGNRMFWLGDDADDPPTKATFKRRARNN